MSTEPIAAAIAHFGSGQLADGNYLVYDLGGGTFDVSLVNARAGRLRVVDHDGDNHLGGKDLDRVLAEIIKRTTSLMEADRATLYLLGDEGSTMWSKSTHGGEIQTIELDVGQGLLALGP